MSVTFSNKNFCSIFITKNKQIFFHFFIIFYEKNLQEALGPEELVLEKEQPACGRRQKRDGNFHANDEHCDAQPRVQEAAAMTPRFKKSKNIKTN
jgi:hypothetical protein